MNLITDFFKVIASIIAIVFSFLATTQYFFGIVDIIDKIRGIF